MYKRPLYHLYISYLYTNSVIVQCFYKNPLCLLTLLSKNSLMKYSKNWVSSHWSSSCLTRGCYSHWTDWFSKRAVCQCTGPHFGSFPCPFIDLFGSILWTQGIDGGVILVFEHGAHLDKTEAGSKRRKMTNAFDVDWNISTAKSIRWVLKLYISMHAEFWCFARNKTIETLAYPEYPTKKYLSRNYMN